MAKTIQNESVYKRFTLWFRRNEKIFWAVLLVLVVITFGATYTIAEVLTDRRREAQFVCAGRTYSGHDVLQMVAMSQMIRSINQNLDLASILDPRFSGQSDELSDLINDVVIPALAAAEEARRLGIVIPPARIREVAMASYSLDRAREKLFKDDSALAMDPAQRQERFMAIRDGIRWNPRDYAAWVRSKNFQVPDFERALEFHLRLQALRELYINRGTISRKDVYDAYTLQNRTLALAVGVFAAPEFLHEVTREFTDDEIEAYFQAHREEFTEPARVRFSYLKIPRSHFEDQVSLDDDALLKHYEETRARRYLRDPLGLEPILDWPLTPAERIKADEATYRPFAEVKDDVRADLLAIKTRQNAATFCAQIAQMLHPRARPDAADPPQAEPPESIAARYDFVDFGSLDPFTAEEARDRLGPLYIAGSVTSWFATLDRGQALAAPQRELRTDDGSFYLFVTHLEGTPARNLELAECTDQVRRACMLADAYTKARDRASTVVVELNAGKTLAELAGPQTLHTVTDLSQKTPFGGIMLGDEKLPATVERLLRQQLFSQMKPEARVLPTPIDDDEGLRVFVAVITGATLPSSADFTATEEENIRRSLEWQQRFPRLYAQPPARSEWRIYLDRLVAEHVTWRRGAAG